MAAQFSQMGKSNSNGSCQKWDDKCNFVTLDSILVSLNSIFVSMIGVKIGCHFNNSMFLLKKYN